MPYLDKAETWLTQSTLLLQARPSTTRITTKYTLLDPSKPSKSASRKPKPSTKANNPEDPASAPSTTPAPASEPIRATLTLKTYDPASGTTLKYSTTKAAEVSRLIQILGRLGRPMAGLPEVKEDIAMVDATPAESGSGVATPVLETPGAAAGKPGQGGGGAKKGKKKGKK
ncbi:hypothetical protein M430DRAFT_143510 [Amorphotheca resinae ATCC 22711]|uniref:SRP9 domain-containing protein n=1 Tax=Amorphotheca resinae ATCC 22711 TaxID=857342 RepID=A0A2T3AWI4_AMORE|nr:hypothetical protein M430DRAFT_143510 [Amorphotheca resinae ATCC 22711]PSS12990.1 hypothetical protein M430DRAFT_143510 [Amorphotheca resinae ATCC 22711]